MYEWNNCYKIANLKHDSFKSILKYEIYWIVSSIWLGFDWPVQLLLAQMNRANADSLASVCREQTIKWSDTHLAGGRRLVWKSTVVDGCPVYWCTSATMVDLISPYLQGQRAKLPSIGTARNEALESRFPILIKFSNSAKQMLRNFEFSIGTLMGFTVDQK